MATTEIVFAVRVTDVAAPIDRDRALNASSLQGDNLTAAAAAFSVSTADRELSAVRSDLVAAIDTLAQAHEAEQLSLTQAAVTTATQPLHARIAQLTAELTACNEKFESHVAQLAKEHATTVTALEHQHALALAAAMTQASDVQHALDASV